MLFFIISNSIVISSAFLWTRAFYSRKTFADFLLIWFLFFFAEIISIEVILGMFGVLFPLYIIAFHLIILFIALFFFKRNTPYSPFYHPNIDFIIKNKLLLLAISVFSGFFIVKLAINLINPPLGADSLIYHLVFPATWIKRHSLYQPVIVFGNIVSNTTPYFPINAELFFFWLMLPFRNAFLADAGEAPFYFVGILAIYAILKKFKIKPATALFIAFLWILIPNVFKQIKQGSYIDVICAVSFLMSLNFLLLMEEEFNLKNAFLLGMALGLSLGIKRLNIFWSLGLAPLFLYILLKAKSKLSFKLIIIFIILACILAFGGYSYIRACFLTRNILYPFKVSVLGRTILNGYLDRKTIGDLYYPWKEFNFGKLFFGEGLGLQFLVFIFPATFLSLFLLPFMRNKLRPYLKTILIFIIPVYMLAMFLFYIKAYWVRYLFPYLGVGFITAALLLNQFKWGPRFITVMGFICILSSLGEFCGHGQLVTSLLLSFLTFILFYKWWPFLSKISRPIRTSLAIMLTIILFSGLWLLNSQYDVEEFNRYLSSFSTKESEDRDLWLGWKWMNENSRQGDRIAYTGRPGYYPLFGTRLKNDVFYVSVNDKPSLPHYYPDGLFRKEKNFQSWRNNLTRAKVDYLFIALPVPRDNESSNPKEFPIEDKWAQDNPQIFKSAFSNSKTKIYSLIR